MKFAFVENRYKTIFWEAVADKLESLGHSITWLVQNPIFSPNKKSVFIIPFPRRADLTDCDIFNERSLEWVKNGDRSINYFHGNKDHYQFYQHHISNWLDLERPDVVIGESTLFHELIVIDLCIKRKVPYFHPSMPGYPGARFSIYENASKKTLGLNKDIPNDSDALFFANLIRSGKKIPDYMKYKNKVDLDREYPLPGSFKDRFNILLGYLYGEKYNTPPPYLKLYLDLMVKMQLRSWKKITNFKKRHIDARFILYPMQMQPEANLDVWGQRFRDQTDLIRKVGDILPSGWHLLVKANPKAKYEINSDLISLLRDHPKITPVDLSKKMIDVMCEVDIVCTVTGTVAIESFLSKKPLIQLGSGIIDHGPGCVQLDSINKIISVIQQVEDGSYSLAADEDCIRLVQKIYSSTFEGKVSDPYTLPDVMDEKNIMLVTNKINEVARQCVSRP